MARWVAVTERGDAAGGEFEAVDLTAAERVGRIRFGAGVLVMSVPAYREFRGGLQAIARERVVLGGRARECDR
jgi:hypothetical protein